MVISEAGYAVDPDRLLVVSYDDHGTPREVVAVACRYVPATDRTGARRIAVEVLHDPSVPNPAGAYFCPPARMTRLLLPPPQVRSVRPYRV